MATKTGNSYSTGTTTGSVEIPTTSPGFSTTASPNKVSPSDCDNDRQPEKAMWTSKPEILISQKLWQIGWQLHQQIWGFRPCTARRNWPRAIATMIDNRKQQSCNFLVVDRCNNHLANVLSSSSSSKIQNLALEFRRYLSEFQRRNYLRFWGPYWYFRMPVTVVLTCQYYFPIIHALIPQICRWNFNCTFHTFIHVSISCFGSYFRLSAIIYTSCEFAIVECRRFAVGIFMI